MWSSDITMKFQMIEVFAGAGRVSAQFRASGQNVASYDYEYDQKRMNFMTEAGMAQLDCTWHASLYNL